jgi:hypothetical protein
VLTGGFKERGREWLEKDGSVEDDVSHTAHALCVLA